MSVEILAFTEQRSKLYRLFGWDKDTERVHVQQVTHGKHTEVKDLTSTQASELIKSLTTNWAVFDKNNQQHKYILSLLIQLGWSTEHDRYGTVADLARLSSFLKSKKTPVAMPLQSMESKDLSKLISCFELMTFKHHSK